MGVFEELSCAYRGWVRSYPERTVYILYTKRDAASYPRDYVAVVGVFFFLQSFCRERGSRSASEVSPGKGSASQTCVTHLFGIFDTAYYNSVQLLVPSLLFWGGIEW